MAKSETSGPKVSGWMDFLSGLVERHPKAFIRLGDFETRMARERIAEMRVERPIYVTGLARSGSTMLLELLATHPDVATHRYRDFPAVMTPFAWNWFTDHAASGEAPAEERAHKDRILVTPESPEAFEEVMWMAFFAGLHDPATSAVLDRATAHPEFERFYREHIAKLLVLRGGRRYLAKGNYNVTRLSYLQKLFPDACFLVPVRDPVWHIASLMKQHRFFVEAGKADPRITRHLSRTGHFEFGLERRAIGLGDGQAPEIMRLWAEERDVEGWARYWAALYGHVADKLDADPTVAAATRIVPYERLCADPAREMAAIAGHCGLQGGNLPALAAERISEPSYYRPDFTPDELRTIAAITEETAMRLARHAADVPAKAEVRAVAMA
ncbi:hypothetical protein J2R99_002220 [Rhodopseudomonas julia]|uniref:Sulfotransferase family protein n=1 Tax=Rhodopseudomonas julia TaxID=200617 RepID=A0ABU0C748_9BRAD|nr:sulfotransferase [Rhodopseudomonas julia]MDQ0326351.1 hypothetical protein [Rhodopseudomonas julia]